MHLTLQQLRLFQAVVRHGSFTRAAEAMHLTQPAVSIQVKRLEEQAGLPLLEQIGKKIYPTAAGRLVLKHGTAVLDQLETLDQELDSLRGEIKGPLQISVVTTGKYFMPHLLGRFLQQYPGVEPRLKFTNRARVVERLNQNLDDFVVMGQVPPARNLVSHPFLENVLGFVAPADHPLAGRRRIPLKRVLQERFIAREQGSGTRRVVEEMLEKKGIAIEPYMELGSSEAIKQAVIAGIGVAVLSLHGVRLEQEAGRLTVLDVQGFPIRRRWYAVHLEGKQLSLVARTFLDFILAEGPKVLQGE